MKKSQISLQFNWIFIFIVGAIILVFFLMVIKNQTKDANYELAGDIIRNLDTIIKSSEQVEGTFKIIKIPPVTIEFVCEDNISYYDIGNGISKDIPYDIIFAQKKLTGNELLSWTKGWDVPFRIGTFQYLTTKRTQFIVVNDTNSMAEELFNILPENITKIFIQLNEYVEDNNYDYYKIIQFADRKLQNGMVKAPIDRVHTITIQTTQGLDSSGDIFFEEEGETLKFLKLESLLGAIFAHDAEFYKCTMDKAFQRLKILINLTASRIERLESLTTNDKCESLFGWSLQDSKNMLSNIETNGLDSSHDIYQLSKDIARGNQNLIRGKNCALIY